MSEIEQVSAIAIDWHSKLVDDRSVKFYLPEPYREYQVFSTREEHFCVTFDKPIPVTLVLKMMVIKDEKDTSLVLADDRAKQLTATKVIKITSDSGLILVPNGWLANQLADNHDGILKRAFARLVADFKLVIGNQVIKANEVALMARSGI